MSLHPQGTLRLLRGRVGSSARLTWRLLVSPWSQALLVCFCFSAEGRQGVNPSGGSRQPAKRQPSPAVLPAHPNRRCRPRLDSGQPHRAAHAPGQPGAGVGQLSPLPCHRATPGLGTPTLVLQGLQSLLSLVVQLLQVRGPRAGEEDVVGTLLARRVLHTQPLLGLTLGSACGDRGVSLGSQSRRIIA